MKPKMHPIFHPVLFAALGLVGLTCPTHAAILYWDGFTSTVNTQSDNTSTSAANWLSDGFWDNGTSSAALASWTADDSAIFGGSAASQTITAGTFTVGNLTFGGGALGTNSTGTAYTLTGGTITLSNSTIAAHTDTTIYSILAGSTGLIKSGSGKLTLLGSNNYSGITTVNSGILQIGNGGIIGSIGSGGFAVNGGTLAFNRSDTPTFGGAITMNGGTISQLAASTVTLSGGLPALIGNASLTSVAGGTLIIGSASTRTEIKLAGYTLTVGGEGNTVLNQYGNGTVGATHPGTLTKTGTGTLTLTSNLRLGNGGYVNIQGGVLSVQAAQLYNYVVMATGNISISGGGVLELQQWTYSAQASLGALRTTSDAIVIDGGTIRMSNGATATNYGRGFTVNAGGATLEANGSTLWTLSNTDAAVYNSNPSLTFSGSGLGQFDKVFSGSGALTKTGSGTWTLTATNLHSGATNVTGGKLTISSSGSINDTSGVSIGAGELNYNSSTALSKTITFSGTGGTLSGSGTISNAVVVTNNNIQTAGTSVKAGQATATLGTATLSNGITYEQGSIFEWNLTANTDTSNGTRGVNYDAVNAGSLATSGSGAIFRVVLNESQNFSEAFWNTSRTWSDIFVKISDSSNININPIFGGGVQYWNSTGDLGTPTTQGYFTMTDNSLTWTAVPEPSSALAGFLIAASLLRRRR